MIRGTGTLGDWSHNLLERSDDEGDPWKPASQPRAYPVAAPPGSTSRSNVVGRFTKAPSTSTSSGGRRPSQSASVARPETTSTVERQEPVREQDALNLHQHEPLPQHPVTLQQRRA
jgi:hypothetical protein